MTEIFLGEVSASIVDSARNFYEPFGKLSYWLIAIYLIHSDITKKVVFLLQHLQKINITKKGILPDNLY